MYVCIYIYIYNIYIYIYTIYSLSILAKVPCLIRDVNGEMNLCGYCTEI